MFLLNNEHVQNKYEIITNKIHKSVQLTITKIVYKNASSIPKIASIK